MTDKLDFANNREEFQTLSYTDLMLQGRSKIVRLPTVSEILSYEYTLDSGYLYPHCGVAIIPTPPKKYFEIANYDEIEIEITATKGKRISVQLSMFM
ncbi:MAG TPA: hypothetical protein VL947_02485, partial [Cytophagales bacterium]|nr:hypothetical protein [Cytophagales bacterium]